MENKDKKYPHEIKNNQPIENQKYPNEKNENCKDKEKKEEHRISYIVKEISFIKWEDIAGLETAKKILKDSVIFPIKNSIEFQGKQKPLKNLLLYGPPGTGKTYLLRAMAAELGENLLYISCCLIISKWLSCDSDKTIKNIFDLAKKKKNAVIFLDEIDCILSSQSYHEDEVKRIIKNEFLLQMKSIESNNESIFILGTTNIPWSLDTDIINIFNKKIYISLPDYADRKKMIELNLKNLDNNLTIEQIDYIAKKTKDFSGSDIYSFIQDAYYEPLRKCMKSEFFKKIPGNNKDQWNYVPCEQNDSGAIKMKMSEIPNQKSILPQKIDFEDFKKVLERTKPTVTPQYLEKYEKFTLEFGQVNN